MPEPIYYLEVYKGQPLTRIYTVEEVANRITVENNIILGSEMSEEFYNSFSFYKVNLIYQVPDELKELDEHYLQLLPDNIVSITSAGNRYDVVIEVTKHTYILESEWYQIRTKRNQLLQDTDWVDQSSSRLDLTNDTRNKYKAYRRYLRDITDIYDLPNKVVWVTPPEIEYKEKYFFTRYMPEQLEKIKNYIPPAKSAADWNKFLAAWRETNFIDLVVGVDSLIHMHLTININEIIK